MRCLNLIDNNGKREQFGFAFSNQNIDLKKIIQGEAQNIRDSKNNIMSFRIAPGSKHVKVSAPLDLAFAEAWANVGEPNSSGRWITITHYNITTSIPGDGVYLAEYNNSGYRKTLYSSPALPAQGLVEVNRSYLVASNLYAQLDVTVTGLYDINHIPFPIPMIYANSILL